MFETKAIAKHFKDFFSTLASNLVSKLPKPPNRFGIEYLSTFYKNLNIKHSLNFTHVSEEDILKIMSNLDATKATGIDYLPSRFLELGSHRATELEIIAKLAITRNYRQNSDNVILV